MADISDIVLRIRVDIVNSQAITGLISTMNRANSAISAVSKTSARAVTGQAALEAGWRKTGAATSLNVGLNKRLNQGMSDMNQTGKKTILSQNEQYNVNRRLNAGLAMLTGATIKTGAASSLNVGVNKKLNAGLASLTATGQKTVLSTNDQYTATKRLNAGLALLTGSNIKTGASSRTNVGINKQLNAGIAKITASSRMSSLATNEQYQSNLRLNRGVATVVAQGNRRRATEQAQAQQTMRATLATNALYDKNKKLYSISSLLGQAQGKLGSAIGKIVDPLSKVERKMDAVFRAGVHMQSMGQQLVNFASKLVGVGTQLLASWGDFEFTMNRAAAASDIFSQQSPLYDKLKTAIYGAAKELRLFPAETVAKAVYFWQSTTGDSIDTQEKLASTMKNVTAVMKLAAMTDSDYETTIKGVYSTMKQFGKTTKDTADISALLYYAAQKTALELPDLISSFKMTGAVAGLANEPLTSMVSVLGAIGNAGFRGSQAGRALRQTYIKIVKPTAVAKAELDKLFKSQGGYNKVVFNSKGNFIGIEKYMMKLAAATKNMTYAQKAHLLATITTANEYPVMTQMLRMASQALANGDKTWTQFVANQQIANDTFNKSWEMVSTSWKGVVGGLKQSVQPILLEVGNIIAKMLTPTLQSLSDMVWSMGPAMEDMAKGLADSFRPVVEWVGKALDTVAEWARANQKVVATFAKYGIIATIISGVAGAFLLLAGTITLLIANLTIVVLGAAPMIAVFLAAGVIIAAFAVGVYRNVGGIKTSMERFGAAVLRAFNIFTTGSGTASLTATDLATAFKKLSDSVTTRVASILDRISSALEKLTPGQANAIKNIVKALLLLKALNTGLGLVVGTIQGLTGNISLMATMMQRSTKKIIDFLDAFSPSKIKKAIDDMTGLAKTVTEKMKDIAGAMDSGAVKGGASAAGGFVSGLIGGIAGAIAAAAPAAVAIVVEAVGGWVPTIIIAIVAAIAAAIGAAYATNFFGFKDFIDGIARWVTTVAIPAVLGFGKMIADNFFAGVAALQTWVGQVVAWFSGLPTAITTFAGEVITNIQGFVGSLISTIVGALTEFAAHWDYYLGYVLGVIIAFPIKVLIEIGKFGESLIQNVQGFLAMLVTNFAGFFGMILTGLIGWFTTTIPQIAAFAGQLVGVIVNWVTQLPGDIVGLFGMIWKNISGWFSTNIPLIAAEAGRLVGGIINWISTLPGKIAGFFGEVFTNITNWFNTNIPLIVIRAGDLIRGILNFFTNLPGNIVIALKDLPATVGNVFVNMVRAGSQFMKDILDIGANIVRGVWDGISGSIKWFTDKITDFFRGIVDGVMHTLGIRSPSRVFAEIGTQMVNGLAVGISTTNSAMAAMNSVVTDLTNATSAAQLSLATVGGTFNQNVSKDTTTTVELNVNVTSSDGSVGTMDMNTLAGLITSSDMTRTLERMSTVD